MKIQQYYFYNDIIFPYYKCVGFTVKKEDKQLLLNHIKTWCKHSFGKIDENDHNPRWIDLLKWGEIKFRDERDFNWFLMRWT